MTISTRNRRHRRPIARYPAAPVLPGLLLIALGAAPALAVSAAAAAVQAADAENPTIEAAEPEDEPSRPVSALDEAFGEYRRLYDEGDYAGAIEAGKRVIVLSIEANGRDDLQTARGLTNLAIAQQKNGEYEAAVQNYEAAVDIVERVESRLSKHLVNPLRGLGNTYLEAGRPDEAIRTYDRAVHLTHVNYGPQNLEQADLLDALAESFLRLQDMEEASDIQDMSYQLYARRFGEESIEILPALQRRARWLNRLGLFGQERDVWNQAIDVIENEYGEDDLRLIEALNGLARTYLYDIEPTVSNRGEWALRRALEIAENHPETTPALVADSLIDTGNYHTLRGEAQKARRSYREAWDVLSGDEKLAVIRDRRFGQPVQIRFARAPAYADEETDPTVNPVFRGREFDQGAVVANYTVNARGRTEDITVIESTPPGLMDTEVKRAVRRMVFRPRYVDGQPVSTPDQTFRHRYAYIAERLPDDIAAAMEQGAQPAQAAD
ncbi:MAG TPA: TonB family protein [Woeseiaceae bacterium]|nr:TonB family protein [Woeseiaceae bacterium]